MASKRKTTPGIPIHIEEALKHAWPDGIVDRLIDYEESYFWDILRQLRSELSRIK